MATKNLPEAEATTIDVLMAIDSRILEIYCDVDEILSCEEERCARELYSSCVEPFVKGSRIEVKYIGYVKSGKIIVLDIDGKTVCLCACRKGADIISICNILSGS